jgi:hypothetical protein
VKTAETLRKRRSGQLLETVQMPPKGKTSGAKVGDGTGFKVLERFQGRISRDCGRKSLKSLRK